jgi:hypothetical protein
MVKRKWLGVYEGDLKNDKREGRWKLVYSRVSEIHKNIIQIKSISSKQQLKYRKNKILSILISSFKKPT